MLGFILKRLGLALLVALTVSFISFCLLYLSGDPATAIAGEGASAQDIQTIREFYGFDRPMLLQYADWLWNAAHFNFGQSYYFKLPVADLISSRLGVTMRLGLTAIVFALLVAVPLGVLAAKRPNSLTDKLALFISVAGQAMPSFWFALVLISVFSIDLGWLPASGAKTWQHFILPTIVLGYYAMPAIMRLTRAGMLEVLSSDYIRTARAKGSSEWRVLFTHALRNAIIPVVSLSAVQMGFMLGGSIVVESVFALPGAGLLAWESITRNDLPTVQALILLFSMFYIVFTLLADIMNAWLDPRMRTS
ncbi:ABC transporter permease (plasmid) [Pseudochrobactrum algeriensis]|uniref:Peptide/nickel transport system permease protein n=1 Tax=Pseudochrobactrum saccharolyticum TaxID=354352 RepID=A0A7W8ALM0_9HYPH|nr:MULTISPECIES: ABC transporter permease [Pseudochrobactrum]MBJ6721814.1 ABC transporter permease [Bacillus sp. PR5]MBX8812466.1 ABC transporter permease [Ochrobactrum sp. MR34]KAB0538264.1 ABC transporter permease [Pseudochrobactrum saccharolyticum]MBB5091511.1 peptide/nickel transport system permease protein [Pseudochrobactrum saccharolyticum]MDP8250584.1 ABC transporter permease [Pseudochrobactrum saccharolyticum]